MASLKREFPKEDEPEAKKPKIDDVPDSSEPRTNQRVTLNPADCNLDFNVEGNGLQGSALHEQGFAYCWSGARANVGITGGKYYFGCKIISVQPVDMEDTAPDKQHVFRLGISRGDDTVGNLGETKHSFGFGGTGKFSRAGKFSDYGEKFGVGDTIVCAVNLENKPLAFIGFSKNGKWLGTAMQFDAGPRGLGVVDSPMRKLQWESALFPHVLLKNVVVRVQFSVEEGLVPEEGYKPWACALDDGNTIMGPSFSNIRDCEVMMMVGLPASGKTTWAEKRVKGHPERRYILLGTNLVLDQMKVPGLLRKNNYGERFDRLMDKATGIFNTLLSRAALTPRNYIIDQTNVYKSARKRKLKPFACFQKIAVVVFPKPEELKFRADKRFKEMGKEVPADAVNDMLANFVLPVSKDMPGSDEFFDEVIFPELNRAESRRYLDEMKQALRSAPNLNPKSATPYSLESSVDTYNRPSPHNQGALSVTGGYWQNSTTPSPLLRYNCQTPSRLNSAYQGSGLDGSTRPFSEVYQGNQNPPGTQDPHVPKAAALYGTYPSYDNYLPREDSSYLGSYGAISRGRTDPYGFYGVGDPYRPNIEYKNAIPGAATDPYRSSMVEASQVGSVNTYSFAATDPYRSSMVEASPVGSANTYSFAYNTHGGHLSDIGGPRAELQAPRAPSFLPSPSPYLTSHSSNTYGSPYGTPTPAPTYGNFCTGTQHSGGYTPPRPRY